MHELDIIIQEILLPYPWLSRRAICGAVGAILPGFGTHVIFRRLNSLCRNARIYRNDEIKAEIQSLYILFKAMGFDDSREVRRCERKVATKCAALNGKITKKMGSLGETYVRALILSKVFGEITQWGKLGDVEPNGGKRTADLVGRHANGLIGKTLFEVKIRKSMCIARAAISNSCCKRQSAKTRSRFL